MVYEPGILETLKRIKFLNGYDGCRMWPEAAQLLNELIDNLEKQQHERGHEDREE